MVFCVIVWQCLMVGDGINPDGVLLEMLGEFTTAPMNVGTAVASESIVYIKDNGVIGRSLGN